MRFSLNLITVLYRTFRQISVKRIREPMDKDHDLPMILLEVGSEKMCVKWQHFAEQKIRVRLSMIVYMSAINVKM